MVAVAKYVVHELGGQYAIVPYSASNKPVQGHPLGMSTFPTREAADAALATYLRRATRSERASST